jgi:hypothetical protein
MTHPAPDDFTTIRVTAAVRRRIEEYMRTTRVLGARKPTANEIVAAALDSLDRENERCDTFDAMMETLGAK